MQLNLVNHATSLPAGDLLERIARAITQQLTRDLAPIWERPASSLLVSDGSQHLNAEAVPIVIFDDSDQAGALGYHDRDPHGRAYARVFAAPVLAHGGDWATRELSVASVISHEALEVVVDPAVNAWADDGHRLLYALEVADPVEALTYAIDGVTVSNFVFPSWFDPGASGPYDQLGALHLPFALSEGGYAIVASEGAVREVFAAGSTRPAWREVTKRHGAARSERRRHPGFMTSGVAGRAAW